MLELSPQNSFNLLLKYYKYSMLELNQGLWLQI
jgi:hypothetical protein